LILAEYEFGADPEALKVHYPVIILDGWSFADEYRL
jgi:hypothetical protein